jgi:hypothetical protein
MGGWSYRKAANEFSLMEAPEVHILIQQSWQLFGTFIFRDEVMVDSSALQYVLCLAETISQAVSGLLPSLPWCLRVEDGELTGRRHFHFLIAGFPAHSIHRTTRYWMSHKWEELGGGMARIRTYNPALTGLGYITECLSEQNGGDLYELDNFGLKSRELTLSKALLRKAKRACDRRQRC